MSWRICSTLRRRAVCLMRVQLRVSIPKKHRGSAANKPWRSLRRNELVGLPHGDTRGWAYPSRSPGAVGCQPPSSNWNNIEYKAAPRCGAFAASEHFTGSKRRRPAVDDLNSMDTVVASRLLSGRPRSLGSGLSHGPAEAPTRLMLVAYIRMRREA